MTSPTSEASLSPSFPPANEARLITVPLDLGSSEVEDLARVLSPDERARADRFLHVDVRRRFVVCRGRLRTILSELLQTSALEIGFRYEKWGKPALLERFGRKLHFNVSHSGEWALIAIARSPLGVDLEVPNDRINYRAIASQILGPSEQSAWEELPASQRAAATMQLWVCKESLLKALGLGISEGLKKVCFPLPVPQGDDFRPAHIEGDLQMHLDDDASCRRVHWIDNTAWRMQMLNIIPNSYAALCTMPQVNELAIVAG